MHDVHNTLFWRAIHGFSTERPPVWLMRQAGRSDPAYRTLRASVALELEQLFQAPELAAQISLLPARWGVDALIFFQDILSPLAPMGAPFLFRPGPQLAAPFRDVSDFTKLSPFDVVEKMPFIAETFRLIREEAGPQMPLLGFAGAPLTLLSFLAEGKSPPPELPNTRSLMQSHPRAVHEILDTLARVTVDYLKYQLASGACAVQLFESAAHYFTRAEYIEFALPRQQFIFDALKGHGTTIHFARLLDHHIALADLHAAGADVLSLSGPYSIRQAREELDARLIVQGDLDNQLLLEGPCDAIQEAARSCIDEGQCRGHIFNLNHGILADTPHQHVTCLVEFVRNYKKP